MWPLEQCAWRCACTCSVSWKYVWSSFRHWGITAQIDHQLKKIHSQSPMFKKKNMKLGPWCSLKRWRRLCQYYGSTSNNGRNPENVMLDRSRGKRRDAILKNMRQLSFRQPLPAPPSLSGCRTKREGRGGVSSWMMTWQQMYHKEFTEKHGLCFSM